MDGRSSFPTDAALESRLVQLTRDLVLIESTDSKPEERKRCFQLVLNHLDELPDLNIRSYLCNGYESIVVLPAGVEEPSILFCGHLDVVEHLGPEYYRSKLEGGRIYGPGAGDMKGALAILLVLFRNLLRRNPRLSIGLAITSDEERGGENGARFLVDTVGLRAGAVVIPDGGSIDEVTVEEKGILHALVTLQGRSAHAARPWLGVNPLQALVNGLHELEKLFKEHANLSPQEMGATPNDHWYPTCSVTRIATSNESINRIPENATATLDVRFPNPYSADDLLKMIRDTFSADSEIATIITAPPTHLAPDPHYLAAIEAVTGRQPQLTRVCGGSDARFFRQHGIPVMLSRPLVGNLHGHDEWIDVQSMIDYYRICERYVLATKS